MIRRLITLEGRVVNYYAPLVDGVKKEMEIIVRRQIPLEFPAINYVSAIVAPEKLITR